MSARSIVALAGGVGGAKLALGLASAVPPESVTVIANTGDDIEILGLRVCPDLDTLTYTLAGLANPSTGWGVREDTFACLETLGRLGFDSWFQLGDRDLALHIWRTHRLRQGDPLSLIARDTACRLGIRTPIIPMSDAFTPTRVLTESGELHLQEYLVRERCRPRVAGFRYENIEASSPAPGIVDAIGGAEVVVFCPSNPYISLGPILAVPGIRGWIGRARAHRVAVTPIVGGKAIKGPLAQMLEQLGCAVSPVSIASWYQGLIDLFVLDQADAALAPSIRSLGMDVLIADTMMPDDASKTRLARAILEAV